MRHKSYWLVGIVALAGLRAEAQGTGAWTGPLLDGSPGVVRLSVVSPGLAATSYKMSLVANGVYNDTIEVEDPSPADEPRYRGRFYLDTNNYDTGWTQNFFRTRMFTAVDSSPVRRLFMIALRYCPTGSTNCVPDASGNAYGVLARVYTGTVPDYVILGHFPITPGVHYVEFDWQRETAPGAGDGRLELWIDNVSKGALTTLNTNGLGVDLGRLGLINPSPGAAGTLFLDEFESRRQTYIGALP